MPLLGCKDADGIVKAKSLWYNYGHHQAGSLRAPKQNE